MNSLFTHQLQTFMKESNAIEGEHGLNPEDTLEAKLACETGFRDLIDVLNTHKHLTEHLDVDWSGKWRRVNVRVGQYSAPNFTHVPTLMMQLMNDFPNLDSWEAHNRFERIHPFQDFNGRMGRLIWLSKAIKEGYDFSIPFLHKYYYQTLSHLNK